MVMIRLYNTPRPNGMVHIEGGGCGHTLRDDHGVLQEGYTDLERELEWYVYIRWRRSASAADADEELYAHTLYWCSRRACFGPDNPRRKPV